MLIEASDRPCSRLPIGSLWQAAGRLAGFCRHAVETRRGRAQLQKMPDHMLKDIGISRCEILSITRFREEDLRRRPRCSFP